LFFEKPINKIIKKEMDKKFELSSFWLKIKTKKREFLLH